MKYLWTTLTVKDLDESIAFYENIVGLKLESKTAEKEGIQIAFMKAENADTRVELIVAPDFKGQPEGTGISMGFATEDIIEKRKEVMAKGYEATPIIAPNPTTPFFFIQDPNGVDIQFVQK